MKSSEKSALKSPLWMGLILIFSGIIILLDNLGMAPLESYWQYWPLLLIIIGAARLIELAQNTGKTAGFSRQS